MSKSEPVVGKSECLPDRTASNPTAYRCHLAIIRDEEGGFSVLVLNLPGCGSCGDSEDEALTNVREAVMGVVESYISSGQTIPWQTEYEIPAGAKTRWILVDA